MVQFEGREGQCVPSDFPLTVPLGKSLRSNVQGLPGALDESAARRLKRDWENRWRLCMTSPF